MSGNAAAVEFPVLLYVFCTLLLSQPLSAFSPLLLIESTTKIQKQMHSVALFLDVALCTCLVRDRSFFYEHGGAGGIWGGGGPTRKKMSLKGGGGGLPKKI